MKKFNESELKKLIKEESNQVDIPDLSSKIKTSYFASKEVKNKKKFNFKPLAYALTLCIVFTASILAKNNFVSIQSSTQSGSSSQSFSSVQSPTTQFSSSCLNNSSSSSYAASTVIRPQTSTVTTSSNIYSSGFIVESFIENINQEYQAFVIMGTVLDEYIEMFDQFKKVENKSADAISND